MCRHLISLASVLLVAAAWAQEPGRPSSLTPEEIAANAMRDMDDLGAAVDDKAKPGPDGTKAAPSKESKSSKATPKLEAGSEDEPPAPLLPGPVAGGARGMDFMSRARMDMMVPTGRSHKGVHYPTYLPVETDRNVTDPAQGGVAGVVAPLASLFESDLVTRLDDDHVQFDRAKWVQFDDKPDADGQTKPSMSLEIERGVYDLKNEILMTNQPVKIENPQFLITGDTMLHDRVSGLTRLTGRVRMIFYNEEPAAPSPPDDAPAAVTPRQP